MEKGCASASVGGYLFRNESSGVLLSQSSSTCVSAIISSCRDGTGPEISNSHWGAVIILDNPLIGTGAGVGLCPFIQVQKDAASGQYLISVHAAVESRRRHEFTAVIKAGKPWTQMYAGRSFDSFGGYTFTGHVLSCDISKQQMMEKALCLLINKAQINQLRDPCNTQLLFQIHVRVFKTQ